jgi:hypothetical protein
VAVGPGDSLRYEEDDWRDAIVLVKHGEIALEMRCGRRCFFQQGDLLWLQGLPLVGLHNRGDEPAVLVATSRQRGLR